MVTCSGVCEIVFVVESWNIAVNLDGNLLFGLSAHFSYSSLYVLSEMNPDRKERRRRIKRRSALMDALRHIRDVRRLM